MTIQLNEQRQPADRDEQDDVIGTGGDVRPAPLTRDKGGRFRGSGNPRGRPKKLKPKPTSMAEACAEELKKPLKVVSKGKTTHLSTYKVLVAKLVTDALTGTAMERSRAIRSLEALGAFRALAEINAAEAVEASGNVWTAELEEKYQLLEANSAEWEAECQPGDQAAASNPDDVLARVTCSDEREGAEHPSPS